MAILWDDMYTVYTPLDQLLPPDSHWLAVMSQAQGWNAIGRRRITGLSGSQHPLSTGQQNLDPYKLDHTYLLNFFEVYFEASFEQKQLESIDLSATTWNFVTKVEFESNFCSLLTEEPKLNHWVNDTLEQPVIQFGYSRRCS